MFNSKRDNLKDIKDLMIIIIIISLFQEDNIFGTIASLTYGPRFTKVEMTLAIEHA